MHELGHSLGLKHSSVRNAIMYPYARRGFGYTGLHADDILGIAALYGKCSSRISNELLETCILQSHVPYVVRNVSANEKYNFIPFLNILQR